MSLNNNNPSRPAFLEFLRNSGALPLESTQRILAALRSSALPLDVVITELGLLTDEALADCIRQYLGVPALSTMEPLLRGDGFEDFDLDFAEMRAVLPIGLEDDALIVAFANPFDPGLIDTMTYYFDREILVRILPRNAIMGAIERAKNNSRVSVAENPSEFPAFEDDIDRLKDVALEAPIINFVTRIAQGAFESAATDVHIEPLLDRVQIRYRRDGILSRIETVQKSMLQGIVTRIKILSGLNIVERRLPQDGRMRLSIRGAEIDFRVSIVPSMHGETIALRLLRNLNVSSDLKALGFDDNASAKMSGLARSSNGMVVVTGPTGSGKTTTLYSLVNLLNKEGVKIFTIEDPVEYQLEGVTQLQVNSAIDLTFARALRSVLRQDPDIILVGEIRDKETAQIAIQAALTGHLVLTTLHTNTAVGAYTRLRDMGVEEYLIASTIRGVVAQRLVRLFCKACDGGRVGECKTCHGTRYFGRTVLYEILESSAQLSSLLAKGAAEHDIAAQAIRDGMVPMGAHAASLIQDGVTSKTEIARLLDIEGAA